jgi:hypothetical protein
VTAQNAKINHFSWIISSVWALPHVCKKDALPFAVLETHYCAIFFKLFLQICRHWIIPNFYADLYISLI